MVCRSVRNLLRNRVRQKPQEPGPRDLITKSGLMQSSIFSTNNLLVECSHSIEGEEASLKGGGDLTGVVRTLKHHIWYCRKAPHP